MTTSRSVPQIGSMSTAALAVLVREVALNPSMWQTEVRFEAQDRWWSRLHGNDLVDIWLLTWVHDTGTDLHDHGSSAGAFTVVSGRLEEVRLASEGSGLTVRQLHPGEICTVDAGVVHDVRSPSVAPAISIHAYSPPLQDMTYYESTPWGVQSTAVRSTAAHGAVVQTTVQSDQARQRVVA